MPAPYVIAHWQVEMMLANLGAPLADSGAERAGIYLTNSLTGWEPPEGPKQQLKLAYPELADERDAADRVKQEAPILVILGNPPYNAFAGVGPESEGGLVDAYKEGLQKTWGIKKFNLDDLYVRFFRIAERRIAERTGRGIVCFISNFSFLSDPSYVVMRQRFLQEFDNISIDCLNGDSRETGKLTPDGKPDPSVFSTEFNQEGIRVGTAISLMARRPAHLAATEVRFRDFWGVTKRSDVLKSLDAEDAYAEYTRANPTKENRFSFRPETVAASYLSWPQLTDLSAVPPMNGLMEKRGGALIDIDRDQLLTRMRTYFDSALDFRQYAAQHQGLTQAAAGFEPELARKKILALESFDETMVTRYLLRPFDFQWCYYTSINPIWNRARPALWAQYCQGNRFLVSRPAGVTSREGVPVYSTSSLGDNDFQRGHAYYFPAMLGSGPGQESGRANQPGLGLENYRRANASNFLRAYLTGLGYSQIDQSPKEADLAWLHALAIGYSAAYLHENADGIRTGWLRIPLPKKREVLETSANLGQQIADLLEVDKPVGGVTTGKVRPELVKIGVISRVGGGQLSAEEMRVTVGWGHTGKEGVTMPGKGRRIERPYAADERAGVGEGAAPFGLAESEALALLGEVTGDVYLNDTAFWANVPDAVWAYTIGGYQVMKKWLSYREYDLLGRELSLDELREVTNMCRRIAAILMMQPELNANYRAAAADNYPWAQ